MSAAGLNGIRAHYESHGEGGPVLLINGLSAPSANGLFHITIERREDVTRPRRAGLPARRDAMSGRLEGKTAIVTGSTKGISLGIARTYVREGARVVINAERLARRTPMGRIGTPEEIGEVAVFLASPAAAYITGEILTVDEGWSSYGYL